MKRPFLQSVLGAIICLGPASAHANYVVFRSDAPFVGDSSSHSLTSSDGLLTVAGWADAAATVPASLGQWWWLEGVNSGTGNGALIDGQEAMTLQFASGWGASQLQFLYTGSGNSLAPIAISGFSADPLASAQTYNQPRISNLSYANGTLTFDYSPADNGSDFGILNFANQAASDGSTLAITYGFSSDGAALAQVNYLQVPEPSSLGLLGLGAMLLWGLGRKQKS